MNDVEKRLKYFGALMSYIFGAGRNLSKNEVERIIEKIPEGSETVATLAELYRKEGEKKGIEKGKIEVAKNCC